MYYLYENIAQIRNTKLRNIKYLLDKIDFSYIRIAYFLPHFQKIKRIYAHIMGYDYDTFLQQMTFFRFFSMNGFLDSEKCINTKYFVCFVSNQKITISEMGHWKFV